MRLRLRLLVLVLGLRDGHPKTHDVMMDNGVRESYSNEERRHKDITTCFNKGREGVGGSRGRKWDVAR